MTETNYLDQCRKTRTRGPLRDDTVHGVAMRLRDTHTHREAVARVRGFEGAFWDSVRLELSRFLLTVPEVFA